MLHPGEWVMMMTLKVIQDLQDAALHTPQDKRSTSRQNIALGMRDENRQ